MCTRITEATRNVCLKYGKNGICLFEIRNISDMCSQNTEGMRYVYSKYGRYGISVFEILLV